MKIFIALNISCQAWDSDYRTASFESLMLSKIHFLFFPLYTVKAKQYVFLKITFQHSFSLISTASDSRENRISESLHIKNQYLKEKA